MRSDIVYPYRIKAVQIPAGNQLKCTPAALLEWIRIECLLRSETVQELYGNRPRYVRTMHETDATEGKQPRRKRTRLMGEELAGPPYWVRYGWHVLRGAHHALLKAPANDECEAVVDLQALAKQKPAYVPFEDYLLRDNPRYLCLRFNVTVPFRDLQAELKRLYQQRQATLPKIPKGLRVTLKTWVNYLRWHDWHTINSLSAQQIANKEHARGSQFSTVRIERGISKAEKLIECAEQLQWPPSANFLH